MNLNKEIIDRIRYMYTNIKGEIVFPDSYDGDILRMVYENADKQYKPLNSNQQIVLEWLQAYAGKDSGDNPLPVLHYMYQLGIDARLDGETLEAIKQLNREQQFQVLQAFAEWGMENSNE